MSSSLDRAAELRAQPASLAELSRAADAVTILHRGTAVAVTGAQHEPRLVRLASSELLDRAASVGEIAFLGLINGAGVFGLELADTADDLLPADTRWLDLIFASMSLSAEDAELTNYVVGLANWRHTHVFCARCGQRYALGEGGHVLVCASGHRSHPRVEPVVQMLVHDGERCLLGRSAGWPPGWFSTLAGFVEAGETPEQAAVREVREEARLDVLETIYSGAQFFAGPYSLMLGFVARVSDTAAASAGDELESVIALTRAQLAAALADESVKAPSPRALAGSLINDWLHDG